MEALIWTPKDGAYSLGPMRDGLGWVSEDNVCRGAAANPEHIYFLQWKRVTAVGDAS
jgi:hypothetical protein